MTVSSFPYRPAVNHLTLGGAFFDPVSPAVFPEHKVRYRNDDAAEQVGLDTLSRAQWVTHFGQFVPLPDNFVYPVALRYHGHQFRQYNKDIGDGRGFLFGQVRDAQGRLLDLGTKGSGQTPYSRGGDGRLTLQGAIRETLAAAYLEALGVYTSRTLSVIETGEMLTRGDEPSPARSAVLVRLGHSHIRFGTFQYLAYHDRQNDIKALIDYAIMHYFPELTHLAGEARVVAFFNEVVARSAHLAASWMAAGFVHGVLNTDNMVITGESFDYGPWRFLPVMDPEFTAAYFDHERLYAYARQPEAVAWNLAQLGGTLAGCASQAALNSVMQRFACHYETSMQYHFARRLGVKHINMETVLALLQWMYRNGPAFEQVFFDWYGGPLSAARAACSPIASLYARHDWQPIGTALKAASPVVEGCLAHPYFQRVRPVLLLIEHVEELWDAIARDDDWSLFARKLEEIETMRLAYGATATPRL